MPPKKCKNISGQWTLSGALVNSQEPSSNSLQRKAALSLWQRFSCNKCSFLGLSCSLMVFTANTILKVLPVEPVPVVVKFFVSKPFTGTRSDVLARHESSKHHELSVITYR